MQIKTVLISIALILSLTDCTSYDFSRRVMQQGNLLPRAKINRLKVGMSKEDVAILMGTSLLSPLFDQNHWDYAYTWHRGSGSLEIRHLIVYFNRGVVSRIEHQP